MSQRLATYTWNDVLNIAGRKATRSLTDDLAAHLCNITLNWVWDKYDWRESLTTLPPFYVAPLVQDYGAPQLVIPSDFYGLRYANLVRLDSQPPTRQPLSIIKDLLPTHVRYLPHAICYVSDKKAFRLFPRIPDNCGSPQYMVEGQYKNRPALITAGNLATTFLPFDDVYLEMWIETFKWVQWATDSDPRAGQITMSNGNLVTTGQAGVMMSMIDWVASREGLELGEPTISPAEPLVSIGPYRPNMFGLGFSF